jgi:hypothetical protein
MGPTTFLEPPNNFLDFLLDTEILRPILPAILNRGAEMSINRKPNRDLPYAAHVRSGYDLGICVLGTETDPQ